MYLPRTENDNHGVYESRPKNDNHKKRRQPKPEITAYPRDYHDWDGDPRYLYQKRVYTTAYLKRLGWCMECKENPCECVDEGDVWIDPD